ncbi:16S rRNA (guanine(966)-N(2))-methyltransferase RsmD [bacterium]|nr:16S rRNA (guanine(966)-N(2))-methyltransferase RsmD [bacterium]
MLRIIGGERRGTKLFTLEGDATRPLRGRVRESLFSIIQWDLRGARVLDLFAGSGAMGLEALSRGASSVSFVEASPKAADIVRRNIQKLRYEDCTTVIARRLPGAIQAVPGVAEGFSLVFIMPPYHSGAGWRALEALGQSNLLAPDALVVHEVERSEEFTLPDGWAIDDDRTYGVTRLLFLKLA